MIRLTDEEISQAKKGHTAVIQDHPSVYPQDVAVAEAQVKKFMEWGNEDCDCPTNKLAQMNRNRPVRKRKTCWRCWQALLEEATK